MAETRTERTAFLGLLALMLASADTQGWAYPYWNIQQIDAALNGLANGLRDGTVPLVAPTGPPTLEVVTTGGYLAAGQTIEVVQTFVDAYGRETDAGVHASISTGDGIADPNTAATLGAPSSEASGFEGGLLEVWYSWTDDAGGETLAAPVVQINLPYLAAGLYSQVTVTLPTTPAVAGATGANIYIRHRSGNIVLAKRIVIDAQDTVALDGTVEDCYRSLPTSGSTGSARLISISGQGGVSGAVKTRFYVRPTGQSWTAGDRRLKTGGVDEWTLPVTYPLTYAGLYDEIAPGWPPPVSQVKAIRPVDLATEVTGVLAIANMEGGGGGGGGGGAALTDEALDRELCALLELAKLADDLAARVAASAALVTFKTALYTKDGVVSGMESTAGGGLDVDVAAGVAVLNEEEIPYAGGTITIPDNQMAFIWFDGSMLDYGADWPGTAHAKVCQVSTDSGVLYGPDDARVGYGQQNNALDTGNERLTCPANTTAYWMSKTISVPAGISRLLGNWKVAQMPETGATVTVYANFPGGGQNLTAGVGAEYLVENWPPVGPTELEIWVTIENTDMSTAVHIADLGVMWEETPA